MTEAGLVLEGGATRGVFTSGALDYLMEKDLYFSYVVGVSAGSCNAVDYVSKQIGRTRDCMIHRGKEYSYYYGLKDFVKERSLLDMDMIFNKYPNEIFPFDFDTFLNSDMQCEMVVTNCITGKAEYLSEHSSAKRMMDICRASCSMPLATKTVFVDGIPYVDGGVADSIPIIHSLKTGHQRNVIILTRNKGYRKHSSGKQDRLFELAYGKKYPKLVEVLEQRAKVYNKTLYYIDKWEKEGKVFVLRPEIEPVARLERDTQKLENFYQHGYDLMEEKFEEMKWFLNR